MSGGPRSQARWAGRGASRCAGTWAPAPSARARFTRAGPWPGPGGACPGRHGTADAYGRSSSRSRNPKQRARALFWRFSILPNSGCTWAASPRRVHLVGNHCSLCVCAVLSAAVAEGRCLDRSTCIQDKALCPLDFGLARVKPTRPWSNEAISASLNAFATRAGRTLAGNAHCLRAAPARGTHITHTLSPLVIAGWHWRCRARRTDSLSLSLSFFTVPGSSCVATPAPPTRGPQAPPPQPSVSHTTRACRTPHCNPPTHHTTPHHTTPTHADEPGRARASIQPWSSRLTSGHLRRRESLSRTLPRKRASNTARCRCVRRTRARARAMSQPGADAASCCASAVRLFRLLCRTRRHPSTTTHTHATRQRPRPRAHARARRRARARAAGSHPRTRARCLRGRLNADVVSSPPSLRLSAACLSGASSRGVRCACVCSGQALDGPPAQREKIPAPIEAGLGQRARRSC